MTIVVFLYLQQILRYDNQILPPCLIGTMILNFIDNNCCGMFSTPGLSLFLNGQNQVILLFQEPPADLLKDADTIYL